MFFFVFNSTLFSFLHFTLVSSVRSFNAISPPDNTSFLSIRRDDQELFVGDFISKIIVPHPALNFPKKIAVTYQVYRGWLTRGLSSWSINKVILSDSFGESYSLCKSFILESGKPQHMTLEPGNCYEEELQRIAIKAQKKLLKKSTTTTASPPDSAEAAASNRHIIPLERNATTSPQLWRPTMKVSSQQQNITTAVAAALETNEAEPTIELNLGEVLMLGLKKHTSSSDDDDDDDVNINEKRSLSIGNSSSKSDDQIDRSSSTSDSKKGSTEQLRERRGEKELGTRTTTTKKMQQSEEENSSSASNENGKFVTVQLFQYRLGDVFERAEKYARNTLFPLLSEQISNIFNFEPSESDGSSSDRGDESTDSPIVIKSKSTRKFDDETQKIDLKSLETMGIQVSAEDTRQPPIEKVQRKRNFDPQQRSKSLDDSSSTGIYIDLPTYRPPLQKRSETSVKNFIPLIRNSQSEQNR